MAAAREPGSPDETQRLLDDGGLGPGYTHTEDEPNGSLQKILNVCLSCCTNRFANADFTKDDKDVLIILRQRLVNREKPVPEKLQPMLLEIWNAAFPDAPLETFEVGEHWKRLGFQGKDPTTDVRTGAWAPEQLANFAKRYPARFREMTAEACSGDTEYLFAIACFNVTHMLAIFFDLLTVPSASVLPNVPRATKRQLKHLTDLVAREAAANRSDLTDDMCRRVLDEVFVEVMTVVHKAWLDMKKVGSGSATVTLLDFPKALQIGFDANARFWQHPCRDLDELSIWL
eukprot:TRINITY_DN47518_c0_g1_i1.p1 TRINITY_DN47518_c0_g1~~TRINITY_DN47518_c0_g1_i1.p1  ORF type:complete len:287 (+),score=48.28 TRINITY_DN47518_c0_g1_i1:85-945(+)